MIRGKVLTKIFTYFLLILGAAIAAVPLFWLVRSSLMTLSELYIFPPLFWPTVTRWANYADAVAVVNFPLFFKNTMMTWSRLCWDADHQQHVWIWLRAFALSSEKVLVYIDHQQPSAAPTR